MTPIDAPLIKQEFRDWLAGKEPDAIVGKLQKFTECPLATFITETRDLSPNDLISVAANHVRIHACDFRFPDLRRQTPPWMIDFIHRLDARARWSVRKEVEAHEAIGVLEAQT